MIVVPRCHTVGVATSSGRGGTCSRVQYGRSVCTTASVSTACSRWSLREASNVRAFRSSISGSVERGIDPACGYDTTCLPRRDNSNSGLEPTRVFPAGSSAANVYRGRGP